MVGATQVAYKFHYEISINDASIKHDRNIRAAIMHFSLCVSLSFFFLKVLTFPNTLYMCNYIHPQLDHSK